MYREIARLKDGGSILFEYNGVTYIQDNSISAKRDDKRGRIYLSDESYKKGSRVSIIFENKLSNIIKRENHLRTARYNNQNKQPYWEFWYTLDGIDSPKIKFYDHTEMKIFSANHSMFIKTCLPDTPYTSGYDKIN